MNMLRSEHTEIFVKKNIDNNDNSAVWEKKLYEVTKKIKIKADDCSEYSDVKKCQVKKKANIKKSKENVESMDPWYGSVDMPEGLEANATVPMHYVVCIDNNMGMRDVTARYASKFLSAEMRRLRVDSSWWTDTLKFSCDLSEQESKT
ncbi:unnamed protein product [Onchocerca flexuosa]|uniref:Rad4 domain-containing protein n=1 Tax=Onchocerca flexuosa TaxID=387005 RepID=A0A183HQU6_9BILA|nr:unnamed protein product [Onchocerca flexuosa]